MWKNLQSCQYILQWGYIAHSITIGIWISWFWYLYIVGIVYTIPIYLDMTDLCTTDFCLWRTICLVPVPCISSMCHVYMTNFACDGPIFLVPLSLSYPSSPVYSNIRTIVLVNDWDDGYHELYIDCVISEIDTVNHYRIWPQYQPSWPPRYRGGPDGWEQCFLSFALPRERYPPGRHWLAGPYLYGSNAAS